MTVHNKSLPLLISARSAVVDIEQPPVRPPVLNEPNQNPPTQNTTVADSPPEPAIPDPLNHSDGAIVTALVEGQPVEAPTSEVNPGAGSATNELRGETGRVTSGTSEHRAFSVQGLFNRQEVIDARYGTGLVTNTPVSAESSTIVSQSFLSGIESSFEAELSEIEEGLEDTQQQGRGG